MTGIPLTGEAEGKAMSYDTDILEWSEHQAALLRRRAAGKAVKAVGVILRIYC